MPKDKNNEVSSEFFKGWCACLDSVRASLAEYPNGGGDIEVMTEVEHIAKEGRGSRAPKAMNRNNGNHS